MLSPNLLTHDVATRTHDERLSHAARIRMIQRDRRDQTHVDRTPHRRITVARLAAALTVFIFSIAVVASTAAASASGGGSGGPMLLY